MKFYNLKNTNINYDDDYKSAAIFFSWEKPKPKAADSEFVKCWLNGTATLSNWIRNPGFSFKEEEKKAKLKSKMIQNILENRIQMYNWLVEFRVQTSMTKRLVHVLETTPNYALTFAKKEINEINVRLNEIHEDDQDDMFDIDFGISSMDNLRQLKVKNDATDFINPFDIHDPSYQIEYDCIVLYKKYLQDFIDDRGLVDSDDILMNEEEPYSCKVIFKNLFKISNNLIIKYYSEPKSRNGKEFFKYYLSSVAGYSDALSFRQSIESETNDALQNLTKQIINIPFANQMSILNRLIEGISRLKDLIVDEELYLKSSSSNHYSNKKISNAKYIGDNDEKIIFNTGIQNRIQSQISAYIIAWLDNIAKLIGNIDILKTSLQLSHYKSPALATSTIPVVNNLETKTSFEYKNYEINAIAITDLFNAMKQKGLIEQNTTLTKFRIIFTGKKISSPIVWLGELGELAYFIKIIHNIDKTVKDTGRKHWEIGSTSFCLNNSTINKKQLHDAKKPSSWKSIEKIAKLLLHP